MKCRDPPLQLSAHSTHVIVQAIDGTEIAGVPQDDGIDDEVEAGCPISHDSGDAVALFAELMEEDGACEGMTAFTLVEDGARPPAQFGVQQPVAYEDGTLDPTHFAQCLIEAVLPG